MALSLKHFVLRAQALQLYRTLLRKSKHFPQHLKNSLKEEARNQFNLNKHMRDVEQIRTQIVHGQRALDEIDHLKATTIDQTT